jgi:hypothetical protein
MASYIRIASVEMWLAHDDPERARKELASGCERWTFHANDYHSEGRAYQASRLAVYDGDTAEQRAALEMLRGARFLASGGQPMWTARFAVNKLRLHWALGSPEDLDRIEAAAARLEQARFAHFTPLANAFRAALAHRRGDAQTALRLSEQALEQARLPEVGPNVRACIERRHGELIGDDAMLEAANAALRDIGVVDPTCYTHMYLPGWSG